MANTRTAGVKSQAIGGRGKKAAAVEVRQSDNGAVAHQQQIEELVGDVDLVLNGHAVEIDIPNPFKTGERWFMRQPTDIQYEMAGAVRASVRARVLADPEVIPARDLPPSEEWIANQAESRKAAEKTLADLRTIPDEAKTSFDAVLVGIWTGYLDALETPEQYSLAEELADTAAGRAFQAYLMPRLLVDEYGNPLLDMAIKDSELQWAGIDRITKNRVRSVFGRVLNLMRVAKNL